MNVNQASGLWTRPDLDDEDEEVIDDEEFDEDFDPDAEDAESDGEEEEEEEEGWQVSSLTS